MGRRINRYLAERSAEDTRKAEEERALSKANQPKYIKWLWKNKKTELFLTLAGVAACIFATPEIVNPENDVPVAAMIASFVAVYGFTIGMALQPYTIYRRLIRMNYWSPNTQK